MDKVLLVEKIGKEETISGDLRLGKRIYVCYIGNLERSRKNISTISSLDRHTQGIENTRDTVVSRQATTIRTTVYVSEIYAHRM